MTSEPSTITRAVAALGHRGGRSLTLAVRLDAARHRGLVSMVRQRRTRRSYGTRFADARSETYRAIWHDAAAAVGAVVRPLAGDFLEISKGSQSTLVEQNLVMLNDPVTMAVTSDKRLIHDLLSAEGLPVPPHVEVDWRDLDAAFQFMDSCAGPFVVKPATGTGGGAGVTGSVAAADDLVRVCLAVGRWGSRVLVEQTIEGQELRLLFLDGELLDVVRRKPPTLVGDGRSTLVELVEHENERRANDPDHLELRALRLDLDLELTAKRTGCSLDSVLPDGERIQVKSAVSENARGDNSTVHELSPELVDEARRAAELAHLRFAGIDLVTPDPTASLATAGGAILEVNSPPGLHYHYVVDEPSQATRVAVPVLEKLVAP